jgi:hypothetical protein
MPYGRNNCILDWSYFIGSLGLHHTPHRVRPVFLSSIWELPNFTCFNMGRTPFCILQYEEHCYLQYDMQIMYTAYCFLQFGVHPILINLGCTQYCGRGSTINIFHDPILTEGMYLETEQQKKKHTPYLKKYCPYLTAYWLKYGVELQSQSNGNPTTFLHNIRT